MTTLAPGTGIQSRASSEFGEVLASMVATVPGAVASVLSDDNGDAIDFAHNPDMIDDLDVQLLGAQIGHAVLRTQAVADRHAFGIPSVLVEASRSAFVAAAVGGPYVLALWLSREANLARALKVFHAGRERIQVLLE